MFNFHLFVLPAKATNSTQQFVLVCFPVQQKKYKKYRSITQPTILPGPSDGDLFSLLSNCFLSKDTIESQHRHPTQKVVTNNSCPLHSLLIGPQISGKLHSSSKKILNSFLFPLRRREPYKKNSKKYFKAKINGYYEIKDEIKVQTEKKIVNKNNAYWIKKIIWYTWMLYTSAHSTLTDIQIFYYHYCHLSFLCRAQGTHNGSPFFFSSCSFIHFILEQSFIVCILHIFSVLFQLALLIIINHAFTLKF